MEATRIVCVVTFLPGEVSIIDQAAKADFRTRSAFIRKTVMKQLEGEG